MREADYKDLLITNNLHLTQWTMEVENKVSLITNNIHLT